MSPGPDVGLLSDVRAARAALEKDTRAALLRAAAAVLSEEGLSALTVRRVAEAVKASTKMIYTHFNGKDGLLDALYLHSFASFTKALQAHSGESDPVLRLDKMVAAYRAFALGESTLYNLMFGDLGRGWEAPLESRRQAWKSFETLRDAVEHRVGPARGADASKITYLLWATMHGIVSLELRKLIGGGEDGEQLFRLAVAAVRQAHGLE